jgi:hypothetical protein
MHSEARARIDAAAERHEQARKALLRSDGSQVYSDAEQAAREAELRGQFEAELVAIEGSIEEHIARAEEELLRLEHADPSSALPPEELEAAGRRRAFVADEVSGHTAAGLEDRVKAVMASGDRAGQFLYLHHLRLKAQENSTPEPERLVLGQLAAQLERSLDPEAEARLTKVQDEIAELEKVKTYAYARRHGGRDLVEVYMRQTYDART